MVKRKLNFENETTQKNGSRPAINFDDFESTSLSMSLGLGMSDQTCSRRSPLDSIPSFFSGVERLPRQNESSGNSTIRSLEDISDTSPGRLSSYSSTLDSPEILPAVLFGCKSPTETVSHQSTTTPLHKLPIVNAPANINIFKAPTPKAMAMISLKKHHSTLFGPNASFGRTPKYSSTTNELRTPTKHMAIEELNHRYNRGVMKRRDSSISGV
uniref:(California timema) hypothetical protein n=1 Tax=Timema californicum TaxID=61474 RepID=A0A7R9J447_TIMCA|nr:unnamed protein product [Timema californicum]